MDAKGWIHDTFALAFELTAAEQASALVDNNVNAMVYVVGHPNGSIQEATTTIDANLIPLTGPEVDALVEKYPYYTKSVISGGLYQGNEEDVETFGVAATFVTAPLHEGAARYYNSLRTAALPFLFIFNTELLLIDVSLLEGIMIFIVATAAMLIFAAGTQGYAGGLHAVPSRILGGHDPRPVPRGAAAQFEQALGSVDVDSKLRVRIEGLDAYGSPTSFVKLAPVERWVKEWMWIPALAVFVLVMLLQQRRRGAMPAAAVTA